MNDRHEQSRAAFEALYRHPNTYDASQSVRDHIRQTNEIAWEAWCRALDYAASRECVWEDDQSFVFHTDCGNTFTYFEAPDTEQFPFCACGGRVKIQPQTNEEP